MTLERKITLGVIAALVLALLWTSYQSNRLKTQLIEAQLAGENAAALAAQEVELWRDSTVALLTVNQQLTAIGDARLKEKNRLTQVVTRLEAQIRAVEGDTVVMVDTTAKMFAFTDYRPPVTLDLSAQVTEAQAHIRWRATLDPATLHIELACIEIPNSLVKRATTTVIGPEWLIFHAETVQQPSICNPSLMPQARRSVNAWWLPVTGLLAGGTTGYLMGYWTEMEQPLYGAVTGALIGTGTGLALKYLLGR